MAIDDRIVLPGERIHPCEHLRVRRLEMILLEADLDVLLPVSLDLLRVYAAGRVVMQSAPVARSTQVPDERLHVVFERLRLPVEIDEDGITPDRDAERDQPEGLLVEPVERVLADAADVGHGPEPAVGSVCPAVKRTDEVPCPAGGLAEQIGRA